MRIQASREDSQTAEKRREGGTASFVGREKPTAAAAGDRLRPWGRRLPGKQEGSAGGRGEKGALRPAGGNGDGAAPAENSMELLQKQKVELPGGPDPPFPSIYPQELKAGAPRVFAHERSRRWQCSQRPPGGSSVCARDNRSARRHRPRRPEPGLRRPTSRQRARLNDRCMGTALGLHRPGSLPKRAHACTVPSQQRPPSAVPGLRFLSALGSG